MPNTEKPLPLPSIRRLPTYLQVLRTLKAQGRDIVSCTHIAQDLDISSIQVRKDLALTGITGKPKVGYAITDLIAAIENFLGWDNHSDAFLVGVGSLGRALLRYDGFVGQGLNIVAAFDSDPAKVGQSVAGKEIYALDRLPDLSARLHVKIGILTVPATAANDAVYALVMAGMRAIWNFTPAKLEVPTPVVVEDVRLHASLAVLTNRLSEMLKRERQADAQAV